MEIKNLNNTTVATIADGATDNSTDLTFFGYKTKGYGANLNTNMLHLMEHFRNPNSLNMKPVVGQLWYNSDNKTLKLCTNASTKNWVDIQFVQAAPTATAGSVNHAPKGGVTINGNLKVGATLTASNNISDDDNLGAILYNWTVDGSSVSTGNTYAVRRVDAGKRIIATAKYTDGLGKSESVTSPSVLINSPISGTVFRSGFGRKQPTTAQVFFGNGDTTTFVNDPEVTPYDALNSLLDNAIQVQIGGAHIVALRNDGAILSMGYDFNGQLAQNTTLGTVHRAFIREKSQSLDWKYIAAGTEFTMAIKNDGSLWGVGNGFNGQLGISASQINNITLFTKVRPTPNNTAVWSMVAAGNQYSMAIKSDGTLWATGRNNYGQLGLGIINGSLFGTDKSIYTQVGSDTNWAYIACGGTYSMAIKKDGSLWATGQNTDGQFGNSTTTDLNEFAKIDDGPWKMISCGNGTMMGIKTDGSLWGAGKNQFGQLGLGTQIDNHLLTQVEPDKTWESVSTDISTFAITTDGSLYVCGDNSQGQLGLGDTTYRSVFFKVGLETSWVTVATSNNRSTAIKY